MGAKGSKGDAQAADVSAALDKQMWNAKEADSELIKLLLLGAGESGKSTLFKQMIQIYGTGFSKRDRNLYIPMIRGNTVAAMRELCYQSKTMGGDCSIQNGESKEANVAVLAIKPEQETDLAPELAKHIKTLWADPGIKATFAQRAKFQLMDTSDYFFDHVMRISAADFQPTPEDLVRCRVRTTGIVENKFNIESNQFLMVDVGGQRNERKKWIHCFEFVTAVIYVSALSEYDQVLYEDGKTNRMDESLRLFEETVGNKFFKNTSFILFLNKRDLFEDKIKLVPLTVWDGAKEMTGNPNSFDDAVNFLQGEFNTRYDGQNNNQRKDAKLYVHVTCATDKNNVQMVFGAVKDIIIQNHLAESGLI